MTTNSDKDKTITFYDYGESQNGVAVVRQFEDKVALCLSLEHDGDVEALLDREVVEKLIEAMRDAMT